MAFVIADDKVEDFLKEKADKNKLKQIYKMAERFEQHHKPKPQTNADRIRAMSDEELAEFINMVANDSIDTMVGYKDYTEIWEDKEPTLQWLKSEVKE